jgi:hypothetical protein
MLGATLLSAVALLAGPTVTVPPDLPYLGTATDRIWLDRYSVSSMTCQQVDPPIPGPTPGPAMGMICGVADGTARVPPTLAGRVKAPFRGAITLNLPVHTDSVRIGYARRPWAEYSERPAVTWKLPGSGTYFVWIAVKWHTEVSSHEVTYAVPLWVPRKS